MQEDAESHRKILNQIDLIEKAHEVVMKDSPGTPFA
jgi:hypothetical protein